MSAFKRSLLTVPGVVTIVECEYPVLCPTLGVKTCNIVQSLSSWVTCCGSLCVPTRSLELMCHNRTRHSHSNVNRMRNANIQAMSNPLSANIDSGLMHSICLGYDKDFLTTAALMEVLTKILQQGTKFDTLAETILADRFEAFNSDDHKGKI